MPGITKLYRFSFLLLLPVLLLVFSGSAANVAAQPLFAFPPDALTYLTEFQATTNTVPLRDEYAIFDRLKGDGSNPNPPRTTTKAPYKLGDEDLFWVADLERKTYYQVRARLVALTPHVYMFLDVGYAMDVNALKRAAQVFEEQVYPTNHRYFGEEWTPGVDGDPHLLILNTPLKLAAGYFSSDDELLTSVNSKSNEREMFYIGSRPDQLNSYMNVLSHEFQHMIHWRNQPNQEVWLNEGASVLAQVLNNYGSGGFDLAFFSRPSTQLNSWTCSSCAPSAHYGAGYAWLSYLQDRYGFEVVRSLITNGKGLTAFNATDYALAKSADPAITSADVFKDWVLANYLNHRTADPAFSYKAINQAINTLTGTITAFPTNRTSSAPQYSAQYYRVQAGSGGFTLSFKGTPTVSLVGTQPHSGKMAWWSNKGDNGDATLTRDVDLSSVKSATLKFWTWFDIEPKYDMLYLEVSTNGGKTWETLPGKFTITDPTSGKNYGPALSGHSAAAGTDLTDTDDTQAEWVQEQLDLSKYAGQKIKLRFEYLTDEGYSRQGALLDDFEIPEIGWRDDVEGGDNGWEINGFIRTNVQLPQKYFVRVVRQDGPCGSATTTDLSTANNGGSCILDVPLDTLNAGQLKVPFSQALVVVAPYATKTLVPANFSLSFTR